MAINPPLTNAEQAALAGVSTLARYISVVPDTVVGTARVNQATFVYPLAQLTVDSTSGWSDVTEGMTVYIGSTSGGHERGIYRVRLTPGSTTLYLGETSSQDVGEVPIAIRTAGFTDNDYVTVLQRFDIFSILPVINPATGQIYEDFSLVPGTNNTTPAPLVDIVINNRRNHLATLIADGDTFALEAVATPTSWTTSSGESYTYAWTVPASGWSSVTGDTTDTLNADVEPGNYILLLEVTGSLSGTTERVCMVHVHDATTNPPLLISEMPRSDTRDRTGRRMSFDLYNNRLASIPDGAMCIYFEMPTWANQWVDSTGVTAEALDDSETAVDVDDGSLFAEDDILLINSEQMFVVSIATNTLTVTRGYNGTTAAAHITAQTIYLYDPATDVPTATRQFVGWLTRQDKSGTEGLRQATIELVSPSYLLGLLNSTSQVVQAVSSPATWQQVKPALSTSSFMCWYMLRWRCANIIRLFNYTPFAVDPVGQRLPSWTIDKGTVLQQLQLLATERGNFGCDSEGEFYFLRNPNLIAYADRGSVVVRDEVNASLYSSVSNPRELQNRVAQVRGEAFSWDGAAALPTPYYSDAPKAPGQGTAQIKLPAQVVEDQDELNQLTGDRYAQANNPYPAVNYKILKNRDVIEPAQMAFVEVTIPDYLSASGVAYQANTIPLSVTKTHNTNGTSDIDVTGEGETHNLPGDTVPVPVSNDSIYTPDFVPDPIDPLPLPSLGEFNSVVVPTAVPSPQGKTVSPGKGAIWVVADGSAIQRTFDITVEPPVVEDITPTDAFFTDYKMVVHDKSTNFSRGAYVLGNDGTDSKVAYTTDVYADTVTWVTGTDSLPGIYTQMESMGMPSLEGGVAVYSADDGGWTQTIDLTSTLDGFSIVGALGTFTPGVGVVYGDSTNFRAAALNRTISATTITSATMIFDITKGTFNPSSATGAIYLDSVLVERVDPPLPPDGNDRTLTWTGVAPGITILDFIAVSSYDGSAPYVYSGDVTMTGLILTGRGTNPFTGIPTNSSQVATSDDYGDTWMTKVVGPTPTGDGAFCLSRFGPVALAAADATLEKAIEVGGSFHPVSGGGTTGTYPIAARIPWKKIGNPSKSNNSTAPDFYLASAAAVSGDSLWKVIGGSKTAVTPAVSGTDALGVSSNCIGTYASNRICFIGDVSGTLYIFSSKNSGTSWVYTAVPGAISVRAQRFSPSGLIWIAATATDLRYSDDGGITWDSRTVADGGLFVEIFG